MREHEVVLRRADREQVDHGLLPALVRLSSRIASVVTSQSFTRGERTVRLVGTSPAELVPSLRLDGAEVRGIDLKQPLSPAQFAALEAALTDPTRGGVATTLNEIAKQSGVGITLYEKSIPVRPAVRAACEMPPFLLLPNPCSTTIAERLLPAGKSSGTDRMPEILRPLDRNWTEVSMRLASPEC